MALTGASTSSKLQAWIMRVGCAATLCAFPLPAGVVTVVDAKHVVRHLDAKPEVDEEPNEATSQIAYADRIILNKTDLVGLVPFAATTCIHSLPQMVFADPLVFKETILMTPLTCCKCVIGLAETACLGLQQVNAWPQVAPALLSRSSGWQFLSRIWL